MKLNRTVMAESGTHQKATEGERSDEQALYGIRWSVSRARSGNGAENGVTEMALCDNAAILLLAATMRSHSPVKIVEFRPT